MKTNIFDYKIEFAAKYLDTHHQIIRRYLIKPFKELMCRISVQNQRLILLTRNDQWISS